MELRLIAFSLLTAGLAPIAVRAADPLAGRTVARVGLSTTGVEGNGSSRNPSVSADGRFVAFASDADNLAPGDTNGYSDVFVRDLLTGETTRVSRSSTGGETDENSIDPSISGDGRLVAYWSAATNVVDDDTNGKNDVFVFDRSTGTTVRASEGSGGVEADGGSTDPVISSNGRFVAFNSKATNLVSDDTNGVADVFLHDLALRVTERVSVATYFYEADRQSAEIAGENEGLIAISENGRYIAFQSFAQNLVTDDFNAVGDVFVRDRGLGTTVRASVTAEGFDGDRESGRWGLAISEDGRLVAFTSAATNLVPGDEDAVVDVFLRDLAAGTTTLLTSSPFGGGANGASRYPSFSADSRLVALTSEASNLVSDDANGVADVFVYDRDASILRLASAATNGTPFDGPSDRAVLTADGSAVFFDSLATNAFSADTNGRSDVFARVSAEVVLAGVFPNSGSTAGGDTIRLTGGGFEGGVSVSIGGMPAILRSVDADTIVAVAPRRSVAGAADVVVTTPVGSARLNGAYHYVDALIAARAGNVNAGRGDREDVVFVNGSPGDANRELALGRRERVTVTVAAPSSRAAAPFVLYASTGEPTVDRLTAQPLGIGVMCFPTPARGGFPQPSRIWNNLGRQRKLGAPDHPSSPAPSILVDDGRGFGAPIVVTIQGIVVDDASARFFGASLTNAVVIRVP